MTNPSPGGPAMRGDLASRVAAALQRGHGAGCSAPDEDGPGHCVCDQAELAAELAAQPVVPAVGGCGHPNHGNPDHDCTPFVLVAGCGNLVEPAGTPCPGKLRFRWGQSQAACETCGAWCGIAVAKWVTVLPDAPAVPGADDDTLPEFTRDRWRAELCGECSSTEGVDRCQGICLGLDPARRGADDGCTCGQDDIMGDHQPGCALMLCRRCGMTRPDHLPGDDRCHPACGRPHVDDLPTGPDADVLREAIGRGLYEQGATFAASAPWDLAQGPGKEWRLAQADVVLTVREVQQLRADAATWQRARGVLADHDPHLLAVIEGTEAG